VAPRSTAVAAGPGSVAAAAPSDDDLATIREQLLALLRMSPTLVRVVEIDPSLLADQDYVTRSNPQLEQFLVQHPEVARNPDFYLFGDFTTRSGRYVESLKRRVNGGDDASAEQQLRRQILGTVMDILTFIGIVGSLLWLIRLFLQSRRWTRVFRMQSDVHTKLLDRFGNSGELLQYMNTESGKRFLEAAPIPTEFEQDQKLPGGLGRVLAPLQTGIVLTLLGIGLLSLQHRLPDAATAMLIFGMVSLMPGIGFIISALITWRLSVRLGLLPEPAATLSSQPPDRQ
jgi:hypothetical protein